MEKLNSEKKITLSEFWKSKTPMAIHCNTKEKARTLLNAFDKLGKKWRNGDSYLEIDYYSLRYGNTCYSNGNRFDGISWYKLNCYTIYEFEEVDLDN